MYLDYLWEDFSSALVCAVVLGIAAEVVKSARRYFRVPFILDFCYYCLFKPIAVIYIFTELKDLYFFCVSKYDVRRDFTVYLNVSTNYHFNPYTYCSGVIITSSLILTAAQCLQFAASVDVLAGDMTNKKGYTQKISSQEWSIYQPYLDVNNTLRKYDVAVIELPEKLILGQKMQVLRVDWDNLHLEEDEKTFSVGFGSEDRLLFALLDRIPLATEHLPDSWIKGSTVRNDMLCSNQGLWSPSSRMFRGDIGGALVSSKDQRLLGVATTSNENLSDDFPKAYCFTPISSVAKWLAEKIIHNLRHVTS